MNTDCVVIGKKIKNIREDREISKKELAKKLEVTLTDILEIENGNIQITFMKFIELCNLLNVSVIEIFTSSKENVNTYMNKDLYDIIVGCTKKQQELIYSMVKLIVETKFV